MRQTIFTLLLACTWSLLCYAQTPYDSFAPQAYRPMLELEEPNPQPDTIFSVVVADLENEMLLLMNVHNGEILAAIPLSDDISKWLSVDPLVDKYPNISPYAYAAWNPIKYVDPDGRDVWELDNSGSIVNKITDETQDAFRMNGKQISFEYGSVTNTYQNEYQTTFTFGNEDAAANAFKFMADNSGVEYGLVNSSQNSTIITQHLESKVNVNGIIDVAVENNEVIKSIIHNHPKNFGPSGFFDGTGDGPSLQTIEKQLGYQIAAYIYLPKTSRLWMYTAQDRNVGISDWSINYPMVGTQSNQTPSWMFMVKNFFGFKIKQ